MGGNFRASTRTSKFFEVALLVVVHHNLRKITYVPFSLLEFFHPLKATVGRIKCSNCVLIAKIVEIIVIERVRETRRFRILINLYGFNAGTRTYVQLRTVCWYFFEILVALRPTYVRPS